MDKIEKIRNLLSEDISYDEDAINRFCQVYLLDNDELLRLSKAESNILAACCRYSRPYNENGFEEPGNKISFNAQFIDLISIKTGLVKSSIKNSMVLLVRKGLIIKDSKYKQIYYLNPKYFFKGSIDERTKVMLVYTKQILSDLA